MKKLFAKISQVLATLRKWTVNLLTILVLLYVVVGVGALVSQMPEPVDPAGKVLILDPAGIIVDQEVYPEDFSFPFSFSEEEQIQTRDLLEVINHAAKDDRLSGILIDFSNASFAGISTAITISEQIATLKKSGKPIIAYSEVLSTGSYLMAMHAQEIFVHPSGAVAINGLGGYRDYNEELLKKLRITIHNYSQGDYKSAVEGYTRSNMSEPDRKQTEEIINPLWNDIKKRVASARKIDSSILQLFVDDYSVPMVEEADYNALSFAVDKGLIDGLKTYPQLRGFMIDKFGSLSSEEETRETYPHISWQTYSKQIPKDDKTIKDSIAVVFVQGGIMPGPAGPGIAGAEDIAPLIRAAYEKDSTRALVVRVNSPGGSIIGSDLIRDEIEAARNKGLPVIVSMGDVAASGGVWVSTPANTIFAEPHTITGSIGVAVTIPTLENVFDWAGINFDGVQTGEHAGWSPALPMNEKLDSMFSRWASGAYQHFVSLVAESRERDIDYIKSIAGGRVWLAPKALEIGLIDNIGGITEAIDFAAEMAQLEDYSVDYVVPEISPFIAILEQLPINIIKNENSFWSSFAKRFEAAMSDLNNISSPKATVTCSQCLIEIL